MMRAVAGLADAIERTATLRAEGRIMFRGAPALRAIACGRRKFSWLSLRLGRLAELADAATELATDLAESPRAEDDQDDEQDHDEVTRLKCSHPFMVGPVPWVSGPKSERVA